MKDSQEKSTEKEPITMSEIKGLAECEHCGKIQSHEDLHHNGTCVICAKEIRKGLF